MRLHKSPVRRRNARSHLHRYRCLALYMQLLNPGHRDHCLARMSLSYRGIRHSVGW